MSGYNYWIIRALVARLREPGMRAQRRFVVGAGFVLALFFIGAVIYLLRQPTHDAMEQAALSVFAAVGVLLVVLILAAVYVRKRTGASWSDEEALRTAGEGDEGGRPNAGA